MGFDCISKNSLNIVVFFFTFISVILTDAGGQGLRAHENKGLEEYGRLQRKRQEEGLLKGRGAGEIGGKVTRILTISKSKGQKKSRS